MKKNSSILLSAFIVVICLSGAAVFTNQGVTAAGVLLCGLGLGYILQRSRFCIASAYTDLLLFKDGTLFRAILIFILVCSVGFFLVELKPNREGFVVALGWHTILGGFLFGCGMVLAGGCAAGTIMRLGEGYVLFIPALAGLILGSTLGAFHYPFWHASPYVKYAVFLPDLIGWAGALSLQILLLLALWLFIKKWENH
ncbi:MAG: YeeE/YedE thiosulfate transporter family protein [Dehalobacterium sp.]